MPEPVETHDPDGVDYAWVMQMTFVITIAAGAPIVAALSINADLASWSARAEFALRVGAVIWFITSTGLYIYAKRRV